MISTPPPLIQVMMRVVTLLPRIPVKRITMGTTQAEVFCSRGPKCIDSLPVAAPPVSHGHRRQLPVGRCGHQPLWHQRLVCMFWIRARVLRAPCPLMHQAGLIGDRRRWQLPVSKHAIGPRLACDQPGINSAQRWPLGKVCTYRSCPISLSLLAPG
jgi:hypothetical protein